MEIQMSRDQFYKYKQLHAFALREYKEKKPKSVIVRRINRTKIIPKKIIPSLKSDVELNPFLIISDFGPEIRLYYMLPDCTMLGAENISKEDFEKIERQILKYSKKVLTLPQITAEEMFNEKRTPFQKIISRMKNLRLDFKELEAKFTRELKSLAKMTGLTGKLKNITLTDKPTDIKRFGVDVDKNKIHVNVYCLNSPLIEGIIFRECLLALLPKYLICDLVDLCSFGAYLLLQDELKDAWLKKWSETSNFSENFIKKVTDKDFKKIFSFFGYIKPYLDVDELSDSQSMRLINMLLENYKESNRFIASSFFNCLSKQYKDQGELFDLFKAKEILLLFMDREQAPKMNGDSNFKLIELSSHLIKMQLLEFYVKHEKLKQVPIGINRLFQEFLRENSPIKLELKYPNQSNLDNPLNFEISIQNFSNLSFHDLNINDSLYDVFDKIDGEVVKKKIDKIGPHERVDFIIKLIPKKIGNFKIKSVRISCMDDFNKAYKLKSKPIKINVV